MKEKMLEGQATVNQIGFITFLLSKYGIAKTVDDMVKVEGLAGIKFLGMTKQEASEFISKLKNDIRWGEWLANEVNN